MKEALADELNSSIPRRIIKGIKDPTAASRYVKGGRSGVTALYQERFARALGLDASFTKYLQEPYESETFATHLRSPSMRKGLEWGPGPIPLPFAEVLYALCRCMKPNVVVETGVGSGFSSAFMLLALHKNGNGVLHSVDFPNAVYRGDHRVDEDTLAANYPPGWFVPSGLRDRWTLHLGKTQDVLEPLLDELGRVDLFLRDSEHVYSTMTFEFGAAWRRMPKGGLLLSDNVNVNSAFDDFCKSVHATNKARFIEIGGILKG